MTNEAGLRESIEKLDSTISDLRVQVGVLGVAVMNLADRGREDRETSGKLDSRVSRIEAWKNRVTGGLILISTATMATGAVVVAWILK